MVWWFMKVLDVCKSYFNGFQEVSNFKSNDEKLQRWQF